MLNANNCESRTLLPAHKPTLQAAHRLLLTLRASPAALWRTQNGVFWQDVANEPSVRPARAPWFSRLFVTKLCRNPQVGFMEDKLGQSDRHFAVLPQGYKSFAIKWTLARVECVQSKRNVKEMLCKIKRSATWSATSQGPPWSLKQSPMKSSHRSGGPKRSISRQLLIGADRRNQNNSICTKTKNSAHVRVQKRTNWTNLDEALLAIMCNVHHNCANQPKPFLSWMEVALCEYTWRLPVLRPPINTWIVFPPAQSGNFVAKFNAVTYCLGWQELLPPHKQVSRELNPLRPIASIQYKQICPRAHTLTPATTSEQLRPPFDNTIERKPISLMALFLNQW